MTPSFDSSDPAATPARAHFWTLRKDARNATCHAHAVSLGIELVVTVNNDVRRTQVARTPQAGQALADEWRQAFEAKGWTA
jgi:hypothetical protein